VGPLDGATGEVSGYEIHMGESRLTDESRTDVERPFPDAATVVATDSVLGTYLHGLFENRTAREAFVETVFADANRSRPTPTERTDTAGCTSVPNFDAPGCRISSDGYSRQYDSPYDRAADLVAELGEALVDPLGLTALADTVTE
jgi:adenosylcobyric acid synthase